MRIPLGLKSGDYNSKKSRGLLVNMIAEVNREGDYLAVRRSEGLTEFTDYGADPIRSNIHVNSGFRYFVAGTSLYRFSTGAATNLGTVGGSGRAQVLSNGVTGDNQVLVLNGAGDGYIYDSGGLNQIVDADFHDSTSAAILNERFWLVRDDTGEIFASDISDGTAYDPLSFITGEWKPDTARIIVSKKSAIWLIGDSTTEYFQSYTDPIVPLRAVRGASKDIGILAKSSFAELDDVFVFLADDGTAQLFEGTEARKISDLDLELRIRGDGTTRFPGFTNEEIQNCEGFFVDAPGHKIYYLSFPLKQFTWAYDLSTGLSFTRQTSAYAWRAIRSVTDGNIVYLGDRLDGKIWTLDPGAKTDGDDALTATMRCPSISFKKDVFIPCITVEMEVGVQETPSTTPPYMMVRFSKDGGKNWTNHSQVSLGAWGDSNKRVVLRRFGRLIRNSDFVLELSVSDPVRVQFYDIDAEIEESI